MKKSQNKSRANTAKKQTKTDPLLARLVAWVEGESTPVKASDFKNKLGEVYLQKLREAYKSKNPNAELQEDTIDSLVGELGINSAAPLQRQAAEELRTQYKTLSPDEIAEIKSKSLYLALPVEQRDALCRLIGVEALGRTSKINIDEVEFGYRALAMSLAYHILKNSDQGAKDNFSAIFEKCKLVFPNALLENGEFENDVVEDNLQSLEQYISNYQAAESKSAADRASPNYTSTIVTDAFDNIDIRPNQTLSPEWLQLIIADKERLVGKLAKDAEKIDRANKGATPRDLNHALELSAKINFPEVYAAIQALDDKTLTERGLRKQEVEKFVVDYYKAKLKAKKTLSEDFTKALLKAIELIPKLKTEDHMPEIDLVYSEVMQANVDSILGVGSTLPKPTKNYYMQKLPANDLRGFYLGELTNCCQSIDGDGARPVSYGMTQPNGAFYVICEMSGDQPNPAKDRIVAQSFAWRGADGKSFVFDSFERLGPEHNKLCRIFTKSAADQLTKEEYNYVGLGDGGHTPNDGLDRALSSVRMHEAAGYTLNQNGLLYGDSIWQYNAAQEFSVLEKLLMLYQNDLLENHFDQVLDIKLSDVINFSIKLDDSKFLEKVLAKFNVTDDSNSKDCENIIKGLISSDKINILNIVATNTKYNFSIDDLNYAILFQKQGVFDIITSHSSYDTIKLTSTELRYAIIWKDIKIFNKIISNKSYDNIELESNVLTAAIESGNSEILDKILAHKNCTIPEYIIRNVIESGNSEILDKILARPDCTISSFHVGLAIESGNSKIVNIIVAHKNCTISEYNVRQGITSGNSEIVNIIVDKILEHPSPSCKISQYHITDAIKSGNSEIVYKILTDPDCIISQYHITDAIESGNSKIVDIIVARTSCTISEDHITQAIKSNNLDILKNLLKHESCAISEDHIRLVIKSNNLDILKNLLKHESSKISANHITQAIKSNNLEILDNLLKHKSCKISANHITDAIESEKTEILDIILTHKSCIIPEYIIGNAIRSGNTELLDNLLQYESCKISEYNIKQAIESENTEIVDKLLVHPRCANISYEMDRVIGYIIKHKKTDILTKLLKSENNFNREEQKLILNFALESTDLNLIKAALSHKSFKYAPIDTQQMIAIIKNKDQELSDIAINKCSSATLYQVILSAIKSKDKDVLDKVLDKQMKADVIDHISILEAILSKDIEIFKKLISHESCKNKIKLSEAELAGFSTEKFNDIIRLFDNVQELIFHDKAVYGLVNSSSERLELLSSNEVLECAKGDERKFAIYCGSTDPRKLDKFLIEKMGVNKQYGEKQETLLHKALSAETIDEAWVKELLQAGAENASSIANTLSIEDIGISLSGSVMD